MDLSIGLSLCGLAAQNIAPDDMVPGAPGFIVVDGSNFIQVDGSGFIQVT